MGSAVVEVLGILVVWRDSSSALQLAHRQGMGRLKHVEVRLLAIQS